ncbi:MAG TPA: hypothetical protein VF738_09110 [Rhodanobacter sp.]
MNDRLDGRYAEPMTGSAFPLSEIRKEKWLACQYGDGGVLEQAATRRRRHGGWAQALAYPRHTHSAATRRSLWQVGTAGRWTVRESEGRPAIVGAAAASLARAGRAARLRPSMGERP